MLDNDIQSILDERKRTMSAFTDNHRALNMYAIFRSDLDMTPGKLCAQGGHAFLQAYEKALIQRPAITSLYKGTGNGTKIFMYAKNLGQIIMAYRNCQQDNIPCELIIDRGHIMLPHFTGEPIITALGIGPAHKDEIAHITKKYTLLK